MFPYDHDESEFQSIKRYYNLPGYDYVWLINYTAILSFGVFLMPITRFIKTYIYEPFLDISVSQQEKLLGKLKLSDLQ